MQDTDINQKIKKSKELLGIYDKNKNHDVQQSIELLNKLNKNIQECLSLLDED